MLTAALQEDVHIRENIPGILNCKIVNNKFELTLYIVLINNFAFIHAAGN